MKIQEFPVFLITLIIMTEKEGIVVVDQAVVLKII